MIPSSYLQSVNFVQSLSTLVHLLLLNVLLVLYSCLLQIAAFVGTIFFINNLKGSIIDWNQNFQMLSSFKTLRILISFELAGAIYLQRP